MRTVQFCENNRCTIKIQQLDLDKNFYSENEKKIGFNYAVKIEIEYDKDKRKEIEEEEGYIGLNLVDDKWRVSSNKITQYSKKLLKVIN